MPSAYLTVDDAPSSDLPQKVSLLEERDIPALFFCEGRRLADYPERARRAVEAGFHLGNHTDSHRLASELSADAFREELARTERRIEDVYERTAVDRPAKVFRFPYGDRGGDRRDRFQEVLAAFGFTPPDPDTIAYEWYQEDVAGDRDWFWTFAAEDWEAETESEIRARVEASADRLDHPSSDIVLFHDDGNSIALFERFVELLLDRDVTFEDPLDLL